MSHPDAVTPEGWRIGAGFSEFLHGVGHGDLDLCDYCRQPLDGPVCPCEIAGEAEDRELCGD